MVKKDIFSDILFYLVLFELYEDWIEKNYFQKFECLI
jgi:uncharacterized membrane protein (DUF373 family)